MIDFHSHIVYEVDDGSSSIEDSINLLREAKNAGFNSIILTPHYMENYYEYPMDEIQSRIEKLKLKCEEENLNINLYQANEIYITNHIIELLKNKVASSICQSRYVLIELPMNEEPSNLLEVIYSLLENKKVPIIAHPERYNYIQKNPNRLLELQEMGVLFQCNYGSIIGQYGKEIQKTSKLLLKNNYIHFLGSDVHRAKHIYTKIEEAKKELRKILPEEKIKEITKENMEKVINNEEIEVEKPRIIQKNFFQKIFN